MSKRRTRVTNIEADPSAECAVCRGAYGDFPLVELRVSIVGNPQVFLDVCAIGDCVAKAKRSILRSSR
jgi:hypothetical protein